MCRPTMLGIGYVGLEKSLLRRHIQDSAKQEDYNDQLSYWKHALIILTESAEFVAASTSVVNLVLPLS